MSLLIAAAIFAAVSSSGEAVPTSAAPSSSASDASNTSSNSPADAESYAKAQAFLAEVDAGEWAKSWEIAGPFIQNQVSAEQWTATVEPVRKPLGEVTSRELTKVDKTTSLPGAPKGDYEVLQFTTTFKGSESVLTESLIMIRTQDGFDVAGFFIR